MCDLCTNFPVFHTACSILCCVFICMLTSQNTFLCKWTINDILSYYGKIALLVFLQYFSSKRKSPTTMYVKDNKTKTLVKKNYSNIPPNTIVNTAVCKNITVFTIAYITVF